MANWSELKAAVASIVKTNGNKEITGQLLQNVLNNIISNVGLNSTFAGIATPETNPGTPDGNVFYLATTAGTYSNFNGIVINSGEAVILEWKGSWVKKESGFATKEKLSELGSKNASISSAINGVIFDNDTKTITNYNASNIITFTKGTLTETVSFDHIDYGRLNGEMGYAALVYKDKTMQVVLLKDCDVNTNIMTVFRVSFGSYDEITNTHSYSIERITDSFIPYTLIEGGRIKQSSRLVHERALMSLVDDAIIDMAKQPFYDKILNTQAQIYNAGSHYRIAVAPGMKISITAGEFRCTCAFLIDCESLTPINGATRMAVEPHTTTEVIIPSGCRCLYVTRIDGAGQDATPKLVKIVYASEEIGVEIDLSSLPTYDKTMGSVGWWGPPGNHKIIPVIEGENILLSVDKKSSSYGYFGWLTAHRDSYELNAEIEYVEGTSRIPLGVGVTQSLVVPKNAKYLCLVTVDGAGNNILYHVSYGHSIKVKQKIMQLDIDYLKGRFIGAEIDINIDLSTLQTQDCTLGSQALGWYNDLNIGCYHKAVSIMTGYDKVLLNPNNDVYVGFVTNEYNPPYSLYTPIPYVEGTSRMLISGGVETILDIPVGASYLILVTRDGAGTNIEYSKVMLIPSEPIDKKIENISKRTTENEKRITTLENIKANSPKGIFGIMCYNVGGWYNGTGVSIPLSASQLYVPLQEKILERYNSDILFIQEYRDSVVAGGLTSSELLSDYNIYSTSGDTSYNGKAIASKFEVMDIVEGTFVNNDGQNRNYLKGYIYCNGKKVAIISTHLSTNIDTASLQVDEVIELIRDEEYVVLGMDSNIDVLSETGKTIMDKITNAGFQYINKDVVTYPRTGLAIDNIVTTNNITVRSVYADTQKVGLGDDADHFPLLAYLEIF